MLSFLALVRREVVDHVAFLIGGALISAGLIAVLVSTMPAQGSANLPVLGIGVAAPLIILAIVGFTALGVSQMYFDRTRRISVLLTSLPVTRCQVFLARILVGLLVILVVVAPLAIAVRILLRLYLPPLPLFAGVASEGFITAFLMAFACYCIGLQTGWNAGRIAPTLGGLGLTIILVPFVSIKGPSPGLWLLLVVFIAASLVRTWHKYATASL